MPPVAEPRPVPFKRYPRRPERLTPEHVRAEHQKLRARAESAELEAGPEAWIQAVSDWNSLKAYVQGERSRIHYALSRDALDPATQERERFFRESVTPASEEGDLAMTNLLLASRHKPGIAARFGGHFLMLLEVGRASLAAVNSELRVRAGALVTEYERKLAGASVEIGGRALTLSQARALSTSPDAAVRKESFEKVRGWFLAEREGLAGIYDELTRLRDRMGRNLGHPGFTPLGYSSMLRTDYGPEDAAKFREAVRKHVVPLLESILREQARALGSDRLKAWDTAFMPGLDLPPGIVPVATQLEKAQDLFDGLSPRLGAHFRRMREEGLIDLESRPGKRAGAFCTSFADEERVAIFCNSVGDAEDLRTLTHEMGHAFQAWESQAIELVDLRWPTYDACEIHSMGMEFLSLRRLDGFFSPEQGERFRRVRWKRAIEILAYACVVDEFQHWVYANPGAAPDERDAAWNQAWDRYQPGIDFEGREDRKSARWYMQGHVFMMPFYYLDYAIAETGAMQLALMASESPQAALETYLALCRLGGTKSLLGIVESAGMRSPFDPALIAELAAHAARELGLGGA